MVFLALLAAHCYLPRLVATPYGAPEQRHSRNPAPVFAFAGSGFRSSDWATSEPRDVGFIQLAVTFPDFHGAESYALVLFYHIIKGTASQAVRDEGKISHGFIFGEVNTCRCVCQEVLRIEIRWQAQLNACTSIIFK